MTAAVEHSDSADAIYQDVVDMIKKLANDAVKKHGGRWDDYVSAGNEAFMDAYCTYDSDRGTSFSTWLWWKIRGAIKSEVNRNRRHRLRDDADVAAVPQKLSRFDQIWSDLGDDARTVSMMVLQAPSEIASIASRGDGGSKMRGMLQVKLRDSGWTVARILESFSEIREALQ